MAAIDYFIPKWLLDHYRNRNKTLEPIIKPSTAAALSILCTLIYVLPFYLSKATRPSAQLSRDAPSVIRARIRAVTFSCIFTSLITCYIGAKYGHLALPENLTILGWWPVRIYDVLRILAHVCILFLGPLFESVVVEGKWRAWLSGRAWAETFTDAEGLRNYVAGPITEEMGFRSVIIALHLFARMEPVTIVFVTPLYFGIAHVHHFYEFTLTHPHTPILPALLRTLIQFTYTSLFGFYAAFAFLRTGNVFAVIVAHSFCNCMGLPRFWGRLEAPVAMGPPDPSRREDIEMSLANAVTKKDVQVAQGRLSIWWTVLYYVCLVIGAYGFYHFLWTLTYSPSALASLGDHDARR